MHIMLRRAIGALGLVAIAGAASIAGAAAQELRDIRISLMSFPEVSPIYIAMEKGYFEEEGLRVEVVPSTGGAAAIPGLIGGSFEFAYGNVVSNVLAIDKGLDVKVLAGTTRISQEDAGIVVRKGDVIASGKDLEGKTLAVNTRNNVIWMMARAWIKSTGGDPDKVNYKEVPFPQMQDALLGNQVDAAFLTSPFFGLALQNDSLVLVENPYKVIQPKIQVGEYSTTGALIEEDPELVAGFLRALSKGSQWYDENLNTPELHGIIAGYTGMAVEDVAKQAMLESYQAIDTEEMNKTINAMVDAGMIAAPIAVDSVIYTPASN